MYTTLTVANISDKTRAEAARWAEVYYDIMGKGSGRSIRKRSTDLLAAVMTVAKTGKAVEVTDTFMYRNIPVLTTDGKLVLEEDGSFALVRDPIYSPTPWYNVLHTALKTGLLEEYWGTTKPVAARHLKRVGFDTLTGQSVSMATRDVRLFVAPR